MRVSELVLRLYIAGKSSTSQRALRNAAKLQQLVEWPCRIEIIDVLTQPELAEQAGILATPTLAYEGAERPRRIVGDLNDMKRVLQFLGIQPKEFGA